MGYLARDSEDTAVPFVRSLGRAGRPFLWITSRPVDLAPDGGELVRVTTLRGIGTTDPRRVQDLRAAVTAFFDERGPGTIVLDCVETLVVHAGVERLLRLVDDLHEETAMRNGMLVVFVDPRVANDRLIAWLERELDAFPRDAVPGGLEDRLVA